MKPDHRRSYRVKFEKSIRINKPREELYRYWRRVENLPNFMEHLQHVRSLDDKHSHWVTKAPLGMRVEWDAEIITDVPNEVISWRSVEKSDVDNAGSVRFEPAGQGSTKLKIELAYNPPVGRVGATLAKLFGEEPSQQVEDDLHRFKDLMESDAAKKQAQAAGISENEREAGHERDHFIDQDI